MIRMRSGGLRPGERVLRITITSMLALVALSGCAAPRPADAPRDAEGRPVDPGPPPPSTCVSRPASGPQSSCVPVHNPPTRVYVEQAINTLLPTRAYTSIDHVRCSKRMTDPPSDTDPAGLDAVSHWACVGEEIRGRYLHEDVMWSPASGYLALNAVTRDLSPDLTLPEPNDPGLPNPYLPDESPQPSPSPSRSLSQHELARR